MQRPGLGVTTSSGIRLWWPVLHQDAHRMESVPSDKVDDFRCLVIGHQELSSAVVEQLEEPGADRRRDAHKDVGQPSCLPLCRVGQQKLQSDGRLSPIAPQAGAIPSPSKKLMRSA